VDKQLQARVTHPHYLLGPLASRQHSEVAHQ
jgi:hypothetical protein